MHRLFLCVTDDLLRGNESQTHAAYAQHDMQETMVNNRKFTYMTTDKTDSVRRLTAWPSPFKKIQAKYACKQ